MDHFVQGGGGGEGGWEEGKGGGRSRWVMRQQNGLIFFDFSFLILTFQFIPFSLSGNRSESSLEELNAGNQLLSD